MRVLLAQADPAPGDLEANARFVAAQIAEQPADLAVFPELFLSGYDLAAAAERAIEPGHPALAQVARAARDAGTAVVVGFVERLGGGGIANAAACFDGDGRAQPTYRKTHLFGREHEVFTPGEELVLVELAGRRVAPLICFDMEFPEPARALARAGAELLVTIAANMDPYGRDHHIAARARALDNRLPHVYVNRTGTEGGLPFVGGSAALAPDGSELRSLGDRPQVAVVETGLDARPEPEVDYLGLVRPDLPVKALTTTTRGAKR